MEFRDQPIGKKSRETLPLIVQKRNLHCSTVKQVGKNTDPE
jgi:hypothetical protein